MDAVEYFKIKKEYCDTIDDCIDCPLKGDYDDCNKAEIEDPNTAIRVVRRYKIKKEISK